MTKSYKSENRHSIYADQELKQQVVDKAARRGLNVSQLTRILWKMWLRGKIEVTMENLKQ